MLTTKLRVSEHGANFNETITFDKTSHLVTFHVPKHRHLSEHITIMDNATQRSLTLLPEHSYCLLKEIPDFIDPEGTFHTFSAMEPLQPVATPEASEIRHIVDIDIGLATPEELAGERLQKLLILKILFERQLTDLSEKCHRYYSLRT